MCVGSNPSPGNNPALATTQKCRSPCGVRLLFVASVPVIDVDPGTLGSHRRPTYALGSARVVEPHYCALENQDSQALIPDAAIGSCTGAT